MMTSANIRRSPVHEALQQMNPTWSSVQGMAAPLRFRDTELESRMLQQVALCDLSCLPRIGLKGPQAVEWLEQTGIRVAQSTYECVQLPDGVLVVRIDRQEVFVEDSFDSRRVAALSSTFDPGRSGVYLIPRQDAAFFLCGDRAKDVLLETCGFNFRHAGRMLVMTRVAGVSCMILPMEMGGVSGLRLWLDPGYAVYLWGALREIVRDHGGDVIGLEPLLSSSVE